MAHDDERELFSEEELIAIRAVGSRVVNRNGRRVVEPAYGAKVVRAYLDALRPEEVEAARVLFDDMGMSRDVRKAFLIRNRLVRSDTGRLAVQDRFPGLTNEPLDDLPESVAEVSVEVKDERARKYTLVQFFTDVQVRDKFNLSPRRVQQVTRLATADPTAAASLLESVIRDKGYPNVTVLAGSYANSLVQASRKIFDLAQGIRYKDCAAKGVMTPDEVILNFDGFVENGPVLWRVSGPLRYAREVMAIYQLAIVSGPDRVIGVLGSPTIRLGIDIFDCRTQTVVDGQLDGYVELHGVQPQNSAYPADLTAKQIVDLRAAVTKVVPVVADDKVVGSAVRVSERMMLLNTHTMSATAGAGVTPLIANEPVLFTRELENDLCVTEVRGSLASWNIRNAKMDEKVVLCFSVGDHVEFSEVLRVRDITASTIVLSDSVVLRRGCSGAAVIALTDAAFLGIFSTKRGVDVVCSAFTPAVFLRATDVDSVASSDVRSSSPTGFGDVSYQKLVDRGHKARLATLAKAITTVFTHDVRGFRVPQGVIARFSEGCYSTKAVVAPNVTLGDDSRVGFVDANMYTVECKLTSELTSLKEVPHVRDVQMGERVCILAKNGDDVVMSKSCTVMEVQAQVFFSEGFTTNENLAGGLIISMRDAAVLGMYQGATRDMYGEVVSVCARLPVKSPERDGSVLLRAWLNDSLRVELPVADRTMTTLVFSPDEESLQYYQQIGVASAKVAMLHALHDNAVRLSQWQAVIERTHGEQAVAQVAATSGLRGLVENVTYWENNSLSTLLWALLGYISTIDDSGFRVALRMLQLDGAEENVVTPVGTSFVAVASTGLPREPSDTTVGRASGDFSSLRKSVKFGGTKPG